MNIHEKGQLKTCVNHNLTNKSSVDALEYHFITKESITILGEEYEVVGTAYDINTKDDVYILELKEGLK